MKSESLLPIGYARSCYPDKFGTPRQSGLVSQARAFLEILPEVQPELSLIGLEGYSHLWVIFIFHKNNSARFHAKVHPPRLQGESIGLFATRSPHRPNPIGLSLVEILKVEKNGLWVTGIDLIDGTPILDIKPYLKEIEAKSEARSGWTESLPEMNFEIIWSIHCAEFIEQYAAKASEAQKTAKTPTPGFIDFRESQPSDPDIRQLIEQTLRLDPRPVIYRGYEGEESPYRQVHAVRIYDLDVHFRFVAEDRIQIENIEKFEKI